MSIEPLKVRLDSVKWSHGTLYEECKVVPGQEGVRCHHMSLTLPLTLPQKGVPRYQTTCLIVFGKPREVSQSVRRTFNGSF